MKGSTNCGKKERSQTVKQLIAQVEAALQKKTTTPTLGDYIKLIQLQKELEEEEPREIQVGWVDQKRKKDQENDG